MAVSQEQPDFIRVYPENVYIESIYREDQQTYYPPFAFQGVTARVFPLQAKKERLVAFCEEYLDLPPEIAEFQVVFPLVYLAVLNYGKMSSSNKAFGWVSQHEISFLVPLAQRKREQRGYKSES